MQQPVRSWGARSRSAVRRRVAKVRGAGSIPRRLIASPVVYTAALYAASGLGFAVANLLLARALSTADFALVTLLMAMLNLSIPLAAAGMDGVVIRRTVDLGPRMLRRVLLTSTAVALLTVVAGRMVYGLDAFFLIVLFPNIVAAGATFLASAKLRSSQRFVLALSLQLSSNYLFLIAALAILYFSIDKPWFPFLITLIGYLSAAAWVWTKFFREALFREQLIEDFPWHDALFYAGMQAAGILLLGMERLLVPKLLSLADLATLGVLSAIALAPFHLLEMAVGYTLLPRLRAAAAIAARRKLVAYEAMIVAAIAFVGSLAVWHLAPPIADLIVGDKYELTPALLLGAIIAGVVRVAASILRASATAFCSTRELGHLAVLTWLAVGCAGVGAWIGAHWGLVGVIYGVTFGWACRGLAAAQVAGRYFR
jgi:O-antigen/teichoic acid export membrane protein